MKLKKPKFWNKGKSSILPYILLPLSILLQILNSANKLISKKKVIKISKLYALVTYMLAELAKPP